MEAVDFGKFAVGILDNSVPLLDEELEVLVHVYFELSNALRGERVRDSLALSGVFSSVSCVEEAALDGDEGVVEVTAKLLIRSHVSQNWQLTISRTHCHGHR